MVGKKATWVDLICGSGEGHELGRQFHAQVFGNRGKLHAPSPSSQSTVGFTT